MENGTKAIIISVSVLLTIITFTIVAVLYNGNQTIAKIGAKKIDQAAVNYHNAQFTTYFGKELTVSETKILINKIMSSNERNKNSKDDEYLVALYINNQLATTIYPSAEEKELPRLLSVYIEELGEVFSVSKFVANDNNITKEIRIEAIR